VISLRSSDGDAGGALFVAMLSTPVALYNVGRYLERRLAVRRLSRLAGLPHPATRMWMTTWSESRWIPGGPWCGDRIPAGKPGASRARALMPFLGVLVVERGGCARSSLAGMDAGETLAG